MTRIPVIEPKSLIIFLIFIFAQSVLCEDTVEDTLDFRNKACLLFCNREILKALYENNNESSLEFVNSFVRPEKTVEKVLSDFSSITVKNSSEMRKFVKRNFFKIESSQSVNEQTKNYLDMDKVYVDIQNSELKAAIEQGLPKEYKTKIGDSEYFDFAEKINSKWKLIIKEVPEYAMHNPDKTSLLLPKNNVLLYPGGRFKESYYWDTYWIVLGLLKSGREKIAKDSIENLLDYVDRYGFVPNGNRKYFLGRSQPPLLALIVNNYYRATGDKAFFKRALRTLETEYRFWMDEKTRLVAVNLDGETHFLNRYFSTWTQERPEMFSADYKAGKGKNKKTREQYFRSLTAATESGWDFSSRWLTMSEKKSNSAYSEREVETLNILPVDLNSYMAGMERVLSEGFGIFGDVKRMEFYKNKLENRKMAIFKVLFDQETAQWWDYDFVKRKKRKIPSLSNYVPLWNNAFFKDGPFSVDVEKVVDGLQNSEFFESLQMPVTQIRSNLQWDKPNAWSPIIHMIITSLNQQNTTNSRKMASRLTKSWIDKNYLLFNKTG